MNNTKILICTLRKQQLNKSLVLYSTLPSPSFGNCVVQQHDIPRLMPSNFQILRDSSMAIVQKTHIEEKLTV